ncbi:hypothetical protein SCOR_01125 [Sulfidibacter corallicola]|uniref:Uncharacterized protein n=1 Tax=Sulfidibacter corallicola TaxID=2818388 RepID=A0A8A4TJ42_SULCO|nr:hypothetical protein [Sulfidibacter corallicola]QTD48871.1 hypothetical protein J3U87_25085 [Sulfidibacter corallicola]
MATYEYQMNYDVVPNPVIKIGPVDAKNGDDSVWIQYVKDQGSYVDGAISKNENLIPDCWVFEPFSTVSFTLNNLDWRFDFPQIYWETPTEPPIATTYPASHTYAHHLAQAGKTGEAVVKEVICDLDAQGRTLELTLSDDTTVSEVAFRFRPNDGLSQDRIVDPQMRCRFRPK